MTPQQYEEHQFLNQPIAKLVAISKRRPLRHEEFLRLMSLMVTQRMICNGLALASFEELWPAHAEQKPTPRLLAGLFSPKLAALRQLIEDVVIAQGRKVAIFSQWRRMLRWAAWAMSDLLEDAGLRMVHFTGAQSQKQRTQSVIELHDDPKTAVMLLSDAGGVGLNLQRAATCCINLEMPWNPAVLEQRIGRIYRIGQRHPIDVYNLVSEDGIEARITTIVADKQALFKGLFDGTSNEVHFDSGSSSMMSRLGDLVDQESLPRFDPDMPDDDVADARDQQATDVLLSDADENQPAPPPPASGSASDSPPGAAAPLGLVAQEAVEAVEVAAAARVDEAAAQSAQTHGTTAGFEQVTKLIGSLQVQPTADGGVALVAPPEAAASLALLLSKLGEMLAAQAAAAVAPRAAAD